MNNDVLTFPPFFFFFTCSFVVIVHCRQADWPIYCSVCVSRFGFSIAIYLHDYLMWPCTPSELLITVQIQSTASCSENWQWFGPIVISMYGRYVICIKCAYARACIVRMYMCACAFWNLNSKCVVVFHHRSFVYEMGLFCTCNSKQNKAKQTMRGGQKKHKKHEEYFRS